MGERCPTRRQARAVCTSRSSVGASTRPAGNMSSAADAAVNVFPEPVADTTLAREPRSDTKGWAGNPNALRMRCFASTRCFRRLIPPLHRGEATARAAPQPGDPDRGATLGLRQVS
ncbi:hypothetical protein GCM10010388_68430 [Streptomyces mauvecolor]